MDKTPNQKAETDYTAGMKYKEIADKYNVSINTVKSWKTRYGWNKKGVQSIVHTKTIKKGAGDIKEISWVDIENDYITDIRKKPFTLEDISQKHEINYKTIRDYAFKNKWKDKRNKYKASIQQKTIEKSQKKQVDRNLRILDISDKMADIIDNYVEDEQYKKHVVKYKHYIEGKADSEELVAIDVGITDTKAFSNMVSALDKIQKGQRLSEGLDKPTGKTEEQQRGNLDKLIEVFTKGPVIE